VSTRQTLPSWRCTRSDLHGIRLSANSYQLVVSSGLEPSALDDKHGTAGMTQQVFGPLEEPLWGVDPLISGSKVVGHVTWTPALGGRNLRWIDCFCRELQPVRSTERAGAQFNIDVLYIRLSWWIIVRVEVAAYRGSKFNWRLQYCIVDVSPDATVYTSNICRHTHCAVFVWSVQSLSSSRVSVSVASVSFPLAWQAFPSASKTTTWSLM
jgi:hypothetical protein